MRARPITVLRHVAFWEGLSCIALFCVAMPIKYAVDRELGTPIVSVVGAVHGGLFLAFCAALGWAHLRQRWTLVRSALLFLSSLVPFGAFVADRHLRRWEDGSAVATAPSAAATAPSAA